jgi:pyruvate formate lyase activating enzyme
MAQEEDHDKEGIVLEIQRLSTEDGPGIRTTVFLKGCSLACTWCHNPESILLKPEAQWIGSRCIGCGTCLEVCPNKALSLIEERVFLDRKICRGCGTCADKCPSTAMEILGKKWHVDALVQELIKDRAYFENSGGGVTISGGEPTVQADFSEQLLKLLKHHGIQTAIDTCGQCREATLDRLLRYVDMVLYDIKEIDTGRHKLLTGQSNEAILKNLQYAASHMAGKGGEIWVRTPIIPGTTDRRENIAGIGDFIARHLNGRLKVWELCSFNNLCRDKYMRLDRDWAFKDSPLLSRSIMEDLAEVARNSGVDPGIVRWSGSTQLEEDE